MLFRFWTWARKLSGYIALAAALHAPAASAYVFLVNTTQDTVDAIPGDRACADASQNCSLRAAIQEANALTGADTVHLPAGTYLLTIPGNAEHAAAAGDLDITDALIVKGAGTTATIIDGGGIDRIFETIHAGAVQIEDLTLQNGVAGANTPGYFVNHAGGAIFNVGDRSNLVLQNIVIHGSSAESGGAVFNIFSTLEVRNSTFHGNSATAGNGGAIAEGLAAFTRLYNVTLSGNRATGSGGALSTSNNTALLNNVTITDNTADSDGDGNGDGGGISPIMTAATISNSIIAGNVDLGGESPDCANSVTSAGHNLVGTNAGCTITPTTGDQVGSAAAPLNAGLGVLAANGGDTPTHALLNGSLALDTASPAAPGSGSGACEALDQRGTDRSANQPCDIGAYESSSSVGLTFQINSTLDRTDGAIGDGRCETVPGNNECTLRAAVQEANARIGADTLRLPAGTYLLTRAGTNEDAALSGDLDISDMLTVRGAGATTTIIDANELDRVFDVRMQGGLDIAAATIRNGLVTGSGSGIHHQANGDLTVADSIITNNRATGPSASGGGIYSIAYTTLTIRNSAITNNSATLYGGGVANFTLSTAIIDNTTISGNSAGSIGGGLMNSFASNTTITGSTLNDNEAQQGGGIGTHWGQGHVTLINTTVSGNRGLLDGGGIYVEAGDTLALRNSTVTSNRALGMATGGGIANYGTVNARNSLVANNTDAMGSTPDCSGTFTSFGYNLVGDVSGCTIAAASGDQLGTATAPITPRLGPLAANGGTTLTHAPLIGSPAINAGNIAVPGSGGLSCEARDQRGRDRALNAPCDIGAVEIPLADLSVTLTPSTTDAIPGQAVSYVVAVANAGPDSADQLLLTLLLPQDSQLDRLDAPGWSCSESAGVVSCTRPTLPAGVQSILTAAVTLGSTTGSWTTTADISLAGLDPVATNNSLSFSQNVTSAPALATAGFFAAQPTQFATTDNGPAPSDIDAEIESIDADSTVEVDTDGHQSSPATENGRRSVSDYEYASRPGYPAEGDSAATAASASRRLPGSGNGRSASEFAKLAHAAMAKDKDPTLAPSLSSIDALWQDLDAMSLAMQDSARAHRISDSMLADAAKTAGVFLMAGATNWYIKSSSLLAGLLSTLPLWTPFDPLPVLALSRRERKKRKAKAAAEREAESRASKGLGRLLDSKPVEHRT